MSTEPSAFFCRQSGCGPFGSVPEPERGKFELRGTVQTTAARFERGPALSFFGLPTYNSNTASGFFIASCAANASFSRADTLTLYE